MDWYNENKNRDSGFAVGSWMKIITRNLTSQNKLQKKKMLQMNCPTKKCSLNNLGTSQVAIQQNPHVSVKYFTVKKM